MPAKSIPDSLTFGRLSGKRCDDAEKCDPRRDRGARAGAGTGGSTRGRRVGLWRQPLRGREVAEARAGGEGARCARAEPRDRDPDRTPTRGDRGAAEGAPPSVAQLLIVGDPPPLVVAAHGDE